jgi:methyltransferase family protein
VVRPLVAAACASLIALAPPSARAHEEYVPKEGQPGKDVVWVPTPNELVDRMLKMAKVTNKDLLVDLGSGDGRIAIAAARDHGARAIGIEYNPQMVELARREAKRQGVGGRVSFVHGDIFEQDFSAATVVTLYLLPELNLRLRSKLLAMRPGTRIVSHNYGMGDWRPQATVEIDGERAFYWVVPYHVAGDWQIVSAGERYALTLRQQFHQLEGFMVVGPDRTGLAEARIEGDNVYLAVNGRGAVRHDFIGRIHGDRMRGVRRTTGQAEQPFTAERRRTSG